MMKPYSSIWLTWEHQRRSIVLSEEFKCDFHELLTKHKGLRRYVNLCSKTLRILLREKTQCLFVQNPSMILTSLAALYKIFFPRTVLVVDRHSNFFAVSESILGNMGHRAMSKFTLSMADITIVTNDHLKNLVERDRGRALVLQDKIPMLVKKKDLKLQGKHNVLFICSFDQDEPYAEVLEAAKLISPDTFIYVTGNYNKIRSNEVFAELPSNVVLLGYVSDQDYIDYMFAVDIVVVLTNWEHTLLCGAYEAVCAEKPLILSDKEDLLTYFNRGVVKTKNIATDIATAIQCAIKEEQELKKEIKNLKAELSEKWQEKFSLTKEEIASAAKKKQRRF